MINHELRAKGVGASEVAALLGMDPRRDAFAVWARKLNLVEETAEPNIRMRRGKYFERGIAEWYGDETNSRVEWSDTTVQHPSRSWQIATPDAFVVQLEGERQIPMRVGGVDSKMVAWDQRQSWGDPGTAIVPDHYAIQNQWTCSALELPWWDIAACLGDELRVYRIHRDAAIESTLLAVVEKFWTESVLGRTQPPIGATQTATDYLKQRFPKQIEPLRVATPEEAHLLAEYKAMRQAWDDMEAKYNPIENQVRLAIGDAEGILHGPWKVTYKKSKDTMGKDWENISGILDRRLRTVKEIIADLLATKLVEIKRPEWWEESYEQLMQNNEIVVRQGARKLHCAFGK